MIVNKSGGAGDVNGGAEDEEDTSNHETDTNENEDQEDGDEGKGGKDKNADGSRRSKADDTRGADRFKKDLGKLKDENRTLKQQLKERDEAKAKEENRWKDLYETTSKERDETSEKLSRTESTFKTTLKVNKIEQLALKAGLREDALDDLELMDFPEVEVEETDSGRYLVSGADKAIERLKKKKPHWFKDDKAPNFNSGGGRKATTDGLITSDDVALAEKKYGPGSEKFKTIYKKWVDQKTKKTSS
jgi:hypothetical protein